MKYTVWSGVVVAAIATAWSGAAWAQDVVASGAPPAIHEVAPARPKSPAPATVGARIDLTNDFSNAFVVAGVSVWVDDQLVYQRSEDAGSMHRMHAFRGKVAPGEHTVRVTMRLAGSGPGLPYMRGYRFDVSDRRIFVATEGHDAEVTVRAFERGGVTTPLAERPALAWRESVR
jgi:hypothetical protein